MARALHLACYDIGNDARLRIALKIARRHASGGQYSVHECWLSPAEASDLLARFRRLMDPLVDRLLLVRLDPRRAVKSRGCAISPTDLDFLLVA